MVSPPPGVSSAIERRTDRLGEAAGHREAEAQAARRGVPQPLERLEHPLPLAASADPGPRSTTRITTSSAAPGRPPAPGVPRRVAHGVGHQVGDHPLEQPGVGAHQRRRLVELQHHARPRARRRPRAAAPPRGCAARSRGVSRPGRRSGTGRAGCRSAARAGRSSRRRLASSSARSSSSRRAARRPGRRRRRASSRAAYAGRGRPRAAGRCWSRRRARARRRGRRARAAGGTPAPGRSARRNPRARAPVARPAAAPRSRARTWRVVDAAPGCPRRRGSPGRRTPSRGEHRSQPSASSRRASSDTARSPKVSRSRATIACAVSCPVSTDCESDGQASPPRRGPGRRPRRGARPGRRRSTPPTAMATKTSSATRLAGSAMVHRPTGGVKNQLSSRNPASAATRAGSSPPTRATSDGHREVEHAPPTSRLSLVGSPAAARVRSDGQHERRAPTRRAAARGSAGSSERAPPAGAPALLVGDEVDVDRTATTGRSGRPSTPVKSRRSRPWRETPTTTIVALRPGANSTTASGDVLAHHGVEAAAQRLRRAAARAACGARVAWRRPSVATTWTASSSAPAARWASRAPRRSRVSLSGPPVTATTIRSLVGQGCVDAVRPAVVVRARRRPGRPARAARARAARSGCPPGSTTRARRRPARPGRRCRAPSDAAAPAGDMSTSWIWSAVRTTSSGTVSRCRTPVIRSTSSLSDSRCWMLTVVMTSMPARRISSTSAARLACRLPGTLVWASSSTSTTAGARAMIASVSISVNSTPRWPTVAPRHDLEALEPGLGVRAPVGLDVRRPRRRCRAPAAGAPRRASRRSCRRRARRRGRPWQPAAPRRAPSGPIHGTQSRRGRRRTARLSASTSTRGSPRKPRSRPSVCSVDERRYLRPRRGRSPGRRAAPAARRTRARCAGPGRRPMR